MIVYKVVDNMRSAIMTGKFCVKYVLGEEVKPPVGYFYCYKTLRSARAFVKQECRGTILRCEGVKIEEIPRIAHLYLDSSIEDFWDTGGTDPYARLAPKGTVWCSSVTPLGVI